MVLSSTNANLEEDFGGAIEIQGVAITVTSRSFPPPFQRLADLLIGAKIAIALRAIAAYGIADKMASGPKPVEALAQEAGLNSGLLRRVLRALAQFGVFTERVDGQFENSDMSEYIRSDAVPSLRDMIQFLNSSVSLRAWLEIEQSLMDGRSHFVDVNGAPLFKLCAEDQRLGEHFTRYMTNLFLPETTKIAAGYPFGQFRSIIDVGGGQGHIIAAILSIHAELKGALFDIPTTAVHAETFLRNKGLAERCAAGHLAHLARRPSPDSRRLGRTGRKLSVDVAL